MPRRKIRERWVFFFKAKIISLHYFSTKGCCHQHLPGWCQQPQANPVWVSPTLLLSKRNRRGCKQRVNYAVFCRFSFLWSLIVWGCEQNVGMTNKHLNMHMILHLWEKKSIYFFPVSSAILFLTSDLKFILISIKMVVLIWYLNWYLEGRWLYWQEFQSCTPNWYYFYVYFFISF